MTVGNIALTANSIDGKQGTTALTLEF